MLYADFENILKPVNEKFKEKMKAEKKGEAPHAKRSTCMFYLDIMDEHVCLCRWFIKVVWWKLQIKVCRTHWKC